MDCLPNNSFPRKPWLSLQSILAPEKVPDRLQYELRHHQSNLCVTYLPSCVDLAGMFGCVLVLFALRELIVPMKVLSFAQVTK